jgi:transcription antitermination factor NusG
MPQALTSMSGPGFVSAMEPFFSGESNQRYVDINDMEHSPSKDKIGRYPFSDIPETPNSNENEDSNEWKQTTSEFSVDDKVKYWSVSHNEWMDAIVQKINRDENHQVVSYKLDVKREAEPEKVKAIRKNSKPKVEFEVGEHVEYRSESFDMWMPAVVQEIQHENGVVTYNLSVKNRADPSKMRKVTNRQDGGPRYMPHYIAAYQNREADQGRADGASYKPLSEYGYGPSYHNVDHDADKGRPRAYTAYPYPEHEADKGAGEAEAPPANGNGKEAADLKWANVNGKEAADLKWTNVNGKEAADLKWVFDLKPNNNVAISNAADAAGDEHTPLSRLSSVSVAPPVPVIAPTSPTVATAQRDSSCQKLRVTRQEPMYEEKAAITVNNLGLIPRGVTQGTSFHPKTPKAGPIITTKLAQPPPPENLVLQSSPQGYKYVQIPGADGKKAPIAMQQIQSRIEKKNVVQQTKHNAGASRLVVANPEGPRRPPLSMEHLQIGPAKFDPRQPQILSQLVAKLGLNVNPAIEPMPGFQGGRNEGIWFLTDRQGVRAEQYVLKLVNCHRSHPSVPAECEQLLKLSQEHPNLTNDKDVAFPFKLFACQSPGPRRYDLIVMRPAPGTRLAEVMNNKWHSRQIPDIMRICRCVGACLKRYHMRYGNTQHADLQPANVFWDDATQSVTFIDLGGMGLPTAESDNDHFKKAFRMMTDRWGAIKEEGCRAFDAGYREERI